MPALLVAVVLTVLLPLPAVAVVDAGSYSTVIVRVDKARFSHGALEALGGEVIYEAELAPVAVLRVPAHAVTHLKEVPGILHVSRDGVLRATPWSRTQPPQTIPWGISYIDAPSAWALTNGSVDLNNDGDSEIEVAIIDTGIDKDHPDLAVNFRWGIAVLRGRVSTRFSDRSGHGTHVSGIAAALNNDIGVVGVAPSVEIYAVKALTNGGTGSWSDLIIAIDLAVKGPDGVIDADNDAVIVGDPDDDAPEAISMSLGGIAPPQELHDIITSAYNWGIVMSAAAGNEGTSSLPTRQPTPK